MRKRNLLFIDNAKLLNNTNFRGEEIRYNGKVVNEAGCRTFCIMIDDPDEAQALAEQGWNVRMTPPREDEEGNPIPVISYIPVTVGFKFPPKEIIMETESGKETFLDESNIACLDDFNIIFVDAVLSPKYWDDSNGNTKIKAYLYQLYVKVEENRWESKHLRSREGE